MKIRGWNRFLKKDDQLLNKRGKVLLKAFGQVIGLEAFHTTWIST